MPAVPKRCAGDKKQDDIIGVTNISRGNWNGDNAGGVPVETESFCYRCSEKIMKIDFFFFPFAIHTGRNILNKVFVMVRSK